MRDDKGQVDRRSRQPCGHRDETEWVELLDIGANRLVGTDPDRIVEGFRAALGNPIAQTELYGDGKASEAIVDRLLDSGPPLSDLDESDR